MFFDHARNGLVNVTFGNEHHVSVLHANKFFCCVGSILADGLS
jgi:hypothetical protein